MKFKEYINESSLSRLWKHTIDHDAGIMTAFRYASDCGKGIQYTKKENLQRNKKLAAQLKSKGYGVTRIIGRYPEGGVDKKEIGYFIVDLKDNSVLEKDLKSLGKDYEQDSILFIPKDSGKAYLIGTNTCPDNFLGYGKKMFFDKRKLGQSNDIYTTLVNGRPLVYESVDSDISSPGNGTGWWVLNKIAKEDWSNIDINENDVKLYKRLGINI